MKKIIVNPDGSTETIEGTAEELAEYVKKIQAEDFREAHKRPKRKILNEEDVQKMIDADRQKHATKVEIHHLCVGCSVCQPHRFYPIWIAPIQPYVQQQPFIYEQPYVGDELPSSGHITISQDDSTSDKVVSYEDVLASSQIKFNC